MKRTQMYNIEDMLAKHNRSIEDIYVISPRSTIKGDSKSEEDYFYKLTVDLRNFVYKNMYDSKIILMLRDDVNLPLLKDRLDETVFPFLIENKLI